MATGTRERLKELALRAGVGDRLRQVKRAFEPVATSRDRADIDNLRAILGAILRPRSNCVDVEGAEEQVLRGALKTIRRYRPVVALEHGLGSADYYGTRPETIHSILTNDCELTIFDLRGGGPHSAENFVRAFEQGEQVNFLARHYD